MRISLSYTLFGLALVGSTLLLAGCKPNKAVPAADQGEQTTPVAEPGVLPPNIEANAPGIPDDPMPKVSLEIKDYKYAPATLTVKPGQMIKVTNSDTMVHDILSKDGTTFLLSSLEPGKTGSFRAPKEPGTYEYYCTFHPQMVGTLVVKE
jgi:plastocyanin